MDYYRPPAVAGTFYPASPRELEVQVEALYRRAETESPPTRGGNVPKGVIAPHAGYVYSGLTAAHAFLALAECRPLVERIVVLGPAHRVPIDGAALPGGKGFETPLGRVPIDQDAVDAVAGLAQVREDPRAHADEHALEVELPFLQRRLGDFGIVPLVVGRAEPEEIAEVLERVWGGEETRIVISSDLSHYLPYNEARQTDHATAQQIVRGDGPLSPNQACGAVAINGLLHRGRSHPTPVRLLDLRNSGDTAGDREQVVGYGAFAFFDE